jgi:hypothetical protein
VPRRIRHRRDRRARRRRVINIPIRRRFAIFLFSEPKRRVAGRARRRPLLDFLG